MALNDLKRMLEEQKQKEKKEREKRKELERKIWEEKYKPVLQIFEKQDKKITLNHVAEIEKFVNDLLERKKADKK